MENREKALHKVSLTTISINIVLTIAKIGVGLFANSTAVISDGIHSFTDVLSTILVMVGIKISSKGVDDKHQYGHQKFESIISMLIAVFLFITGIFLGYRAFQSLIENDYVEPSTAAIIVSAMSIVVKEAMYHYTKSKAIKYQSSSMLADAWHNRTDAISSIAVLVGVTGVYFGYWFLEPVATIFVAGIIIKASISIFNMATHQVTDHKADDAIINQIKEVTLAVEGVKRIDLCRTRMSNQLVVVELAVAVDGQLTVSQGHDIASTVHEEVEKLENILHCSVHVNPYEEKLS